MNMNDKRIFATVAVLAMGGISQAAEPVCTMTLTAGPHAGENGRPVTVFYVTDGARLGPAVSGICSLLSGTKGAASTCAVAAVDVPDRTAFLTPTRSSIGRNGRDTGKPAQGGRASELVECLEKTVKPEVTKRFEGEALRHVLMGHSFGGLFALHTMAERPELFYAWVAADPSLWWDGGVLVRSLEAKPGSGRPGAFVYAGFGTALRKASGTTASHNLASEKRFEEALRSFSGTESAVLVDDYPRETHGTLAVPVFHEAMKHLILRPKNDAGTKPAK